MIEVGDQVRVRTGGGSAAARKYAGQESRVEAIEAGLDSNHLYYVQIEGNSPIETAFEERDLLNHTPRST